jgi:hypothetical protein
MGQEFTAGHMVTLEAQLFGRDLQFLPPSATPKVQLQPPAGVTMPTQVELRPKPTQGGEWSGWFQGRFRVPSPGEYRLNLQIPDTGESLPGRFLVKEDNPELDDTRPDFGLMYQLASEATDVLPRIKDRQDQDKLKQELEDTASRLVRHADDSTVARSENSGPGGKTEKPEAKAKNSSRKETQRLLFDLNSARLIPKCMVTDSKVQRSRGPVTDLWDRGFGLWFDSSTRMAFVLLMIVGLLSIEWLTRKLLKLA